jgi:hypothetical protein
MYCSAQGELDLPRITVIGNQSAGMFAPHLLFLSVILFRFS